MGLHDAADRASDDASKCERHDACILDACVNTETMRERLDEALKATGSTLKYEVVDLDTLPVTDARRGYPTPTLLYENRDVFGLPEPQPPLPEPS